nr:MAG TPA_asm: protein of unknown function (DUF2610) [Caudoviricetes sp.]
MLSSPQDGANRGCSLPLEIRRSLPPAYGDV